MNKTFMAQNLNSHYTSNPKAERPKNMVVNVPDNLPSSPTICSDKEMNKRLSTLNNDIYQDSKDTKNKNFKDFLKYFSISVLLIMCYKFIKSKL